MSTIETERKATLNDLRSAVLESGRRIVENTSILAIVQGDTVSDRLTRHGRRVTKFVVNPGPEAELIVLWGDPSHQHYVSVGTRQEAAMHNQAGPLWSNSHRTFFWAESLPLHAPDVERVLGQLALEDFNEGIE
ncbi:MAG TPA: hypothetical protein VG992_02320 [Candidatus Saccharimonadales bacterium]|nr:hypothetical protein [Candidatus Saccharimonadales bacterium]